MRKKAVVTTSQSGAQWGACSAGKTWAKHYAWARWQQDFDEQWSGPAGAEYGTRFGQSELSLLYENGQGRPANPVEARRLLPRRRRTQRAKSSPKLASFLCEGISVHSGTPSVLGPYSILDGLCADGNSTRPRAPGCRWRQRSEHPSKSEDKATGAKLQKTGRVSCLGQIGG